MTWAADDTVLEKRSSLPASFRSPGLAYALIDRVRESGRDSNGRSRLLPIGLESLIVWTASGGSSKIAAARCKSWSGRLLVAHPQVGHVYYSKAGSVLNQMPSNSAAVRAVAVDGERNPPLVATVRAVDPDPCNVLGERALLISTTVGPRAEGGRWRTPLPAVEEPPLPRVPGTRPAGFPDRGTGARLTAVHTDLCRSQPPTRGWHSRVANGVGALRMGSELVAVGPMQRGGVRCARCFVREAHD